MAFKKKADKITEKPAGELVMQLAATGNFPQEKAAVEALANALERSAMDSGMRMQAIVDECLGSSQWCPTPFDIRTVAGQMKQRYKDKREGSKFAEWERIYGAPDPDWSERVIGALMARDGHTDQKKAVREKAIRDMLYYTEGEGREMGDRGFWEGARQRDMAHHPQLVDEIRAKSGWQTTRERAMEDSHEC